jgi:hypothetical protein
MTKSQDGVASIVATTRRHALSIWPLVSQAFKKTLLRPVPKRLDFMRVFFYDEAIKKTLV